ncbi:MAG: metallophosphoesterase [Myxococcota bacterium]
MTTRRLAALGLTLAATGCFTLPNRIEGPNYSEVDPPYVAERAPRIESAPELPALAEPERLIQRLIFVGDAGVPMESEPVLASLGRWGDVYPERTTVLFLGDNVYPHGIEADAVAEGEEILRKQIAATRAARIFIPGNHDWGRPGTDRLLRQQSYLDASQIEFVPRDGCPGPVLRPIVPASDGGRGISAIVFDIDPWYFGTEHVESCPDSRTPEDLGRQLGELLDAHPEQWLIVGTHHPLQTGGPHGGYTRGALADFVTAVIRLIFGTLQDTYEEGYREIMTPVEAALAKSPPTLYAAGHDHNLQVLEGQGLATFQVVSGAGSTERVRGGHVTHLESTLFAHGHAGFVAVDFLRSGDGERAVLHVVETASDTPVFSMDVETR